MEADLDLHLDLDHDAGSRRRVFELREEETRPRRGAALSWRGLSVYAIDRGRANHCKQLIHNVRGVAMPGELTAILGSSGAGKSSLMVALAFRGGPEVVVHGDIRVNGLPVGPSYMIRHSGYMHQEDLFVGSMTVMEHLWFMARMKLDRRTRTAEIRQRIERLVREIGLTQRRDTRIGGTEEDKTLSGGEKKRLAFATELLSEPEMLFLDEPTTGQDAHSAGVLVSQLAAFTAKGRTVLCTIHQPSSAIFEYFHRIILIAEGRMAFSGSAAEALRFFSSLGYDCPLNYNPADFFVTTLAAGPEDAHSLAQKICDQFLGSAACKDLDAALQAETRTLLASEPDQRLNVRPEYTFRRPRSWLRLYWLLQRGFLQVSRDPTIQLICILQKMCIAMLAGLCFVGAVRLDQLGIQAAQGVIFILVTENAFFPMYATLAIIPRELPLLLREYRAGLYSVHLYYLARVLTLLPGVILEPLLFTAIIYWLAGLRPTWDAFGTTLLVLVLTMNVSTACGSFFSAAFGNVPLAMAYLVPFDYILMITMGPFIKLGSLPTYVRWFKYLSWLLYSTEALTIVQWTGVIGISCGETNRSELPCITNGTEVMNRYDFEQDNLWLDVLIMILIYILFHVFGWACLWRRCRLK